MLADLSFYDKVLLHLSQAFLDSLLGRVIPSALSITRFHFPEQAIPETHETDLSTEEGKEVAKARLPRPDGDQGRSPRAAEAAPQGPVALDRQGQSQRLMEVGVWATSACNP